MHIYVESENVEMRGTSNACCFWVRIAKMLAFVAGFFSMEGHLHAFVEPPRYTIVRISAPGGGFSSASSINNSGQIAGFASMPDSSIHAYIYSEGIMHDIDTLGRIDSRGIDINNYGHVTGTTYDAVNSTSHAFLYKDGVMSDLGTIPGGTTSRGNGINDQAVIVGRDSGWTAFRYFNGEMSRLVTLGGYESSGYAINSLGQIAGGSYTVNNEAYHAFIYSDGYARDLGSLGGRYSVAYDINDRGEATGYSWTSSDEIAHAFIFKDGEMTSLGSLGGSLSSGSSINARGQVTGYSFTANEGSDGYHAFLYSDGVMYDLNNLVGPAALGEARLNRISSGSGINDWGQIVAEGQAGVQYPAVLLNPVDPLSELSDDGTRRNTKYVAGMAYDKFVSMSDPEGSGTTVDIVDGTAGSGGAVSYGDGGFGINRDVDVYFAGRDDTETVGAIIGIQGTFSDIYVLSVSYDAAVEGSVVLGWDNNGEWVPAVFGNTGENLSVSFQRAYNPLTDFTPGYYGMDVESNTVWAVLNYSGEFAALSVIPEPWTFALLVAGASVLMRRRMVN